MQHDGRADPDDGDWPEQPLHAGESGDDSFAHNGNLRLGAARESLNGRDAQERDESGPTGDDEATREGWVVAGGVVRWDAPDEDEDPRTEAQSPLAADELVLPGGAPDAPRVRAVHAWIARRRAEEYEAMGGLLLAQREQHAAAKDDAQPASRRRGARKKEPDLSPLDLALAEHQAAVDEYDALQAALDEQAAHAGPGRALVEYYLWLAEHLAKLAAEPEAACAAGPPSTLAAAGWRGRAEAALGVRGRVERMTAPPADELEE